MADYNIVAYRWATGAALDGKADIDQLAAAGITHVVDCRAEFDDAPLFASGGLAYLWCPAADDGQPKDPAWFSAGLGFALPALAQPKTKILFHCAAGVNRGPSMCYAALRATGWNPQQAEQAIRGVRPQVGLAYKTDADHAVVQLGYVDG